MSMDLTPENLIYHELIGLPVEVESPGYRLKGVVVDETRNMLVIDVNGADKKGPEERRRVHLHVARRETCQGSWHTITTQPENRIPKRKKKREVTGLPVNPNEEFTWKEK